MLDQESCPIKTIGPAATVEVVPMPAPSALKEQLPLNMAMQRQIAEHQNAVKAILSGQDHRLLVITGPCSLHCEDAALEYARRLKLLQQKVEDQCLLVMRAYLEKPRTTVGWKGLLYAPDLSENCDLAKGVETSRRLLLKLADIGVPLATEALNPLAFHYIDDLISWVAIGARTSESQIHREMVSALSCAAGFKNGTAGQVNIAVHAMQASSRPHTFLAADEQGRMAAVTSTGNDAVHLVMRGGAGRSNYDAESVALAAKAMHQAGFEPALVVDCSHENSGKDHRRQAGVVSEVLRQVAAGQDAIKGLMLESHLQEGRQAIGDTLDYGVSITDACIGWTETEALVTEMAASLSMRTVAPEC
ncbi:MAG: 3-deoxy-7-phosphoheptulonate synthase [Oleiphilaceae bacterium]|nr:3-deoxy-7-phosphoheptulonate synthase [Oleiphilaceae bacterium]